MRLMSASEANARRRASPTEELRKMNTSRLANRISVVTGGARGLGFEISRLMAANGAKTAILDLDRAAVGTAANAINDQGGQARGYACDVTDREAFGQVCTKIAEELGSFDILVNNAMWIRYGPVIELDETTLDRVLAIGIKAVVWGTQFAVEAMKSAGGGSIINIASPAGELGFVGAAAYSAAKGGVAALTRQCATELGPMKIRVNAIAPGPIPTEGASEVIDDAGWKRRLDRTPLRQIGTPSDIANAAIFLASDEAQFMTGHILKVDGGLTIGGP